MDTTTINSTIVKPSARHTCTGQYGKVPGRLGFIR